MGHLVMPMALVTPLPLHPAKAMTAVMVMAFLLDMTAVVSQLLLNTVEAAGEQVPLA
jgi:hypothetical protein